MRFFPNLVDASVRTLLSIFNDNLYADVAIERMLKSDKRWGARDRSFIAETVYEVVRWKRLYFTLVDAKQLTFDSFRKAIAAHYILNGNFDHRESLFDDLDPDIIHERFDNVKDEFAIRESIPDWLNDLCLQEIGDDWIEDLKSMNHTADVVLRVNTLAGSLENLQQTLRNERCDSETIEGYPNALRLTQRKYIFRTQAFKDGLFELQDANSQKVVEFLDPKPGMQIIDACAGAGGKTLQLAMLMNNKGQITALDIYQRKLDELKKRARRNHVHNITGKVIDSTKVIKRLHSKADAVLIDAPCSGLGVLRRNPDSKWKISSEFLAEVKLTQQRLLSQYALMCKPGGIVVYSTCSILPSENQDQITWFLEQFKDQFELVEQQQLRPSETGFDGFYMAKLRRLPLEEEKT